LNGQERKRKKKKPVIMAEEEENLRRGELLSDWRRGSAFKRRK